MPPPAVLQGLPYQIEYISPLARAQKLDQMKSINNFLALVSQIAVVKPDVVDNMAEDEIVKDVQELYGVNPKYIKSTEDVTAIRQARAEQIAKQQEMAQMQMGADLAKTAAEAESTIKPKETSSGK